MNRSIKIPSLEAMHAFAAVVSQSVPGAFAIGLRGPLGVGKTEFVRGLVLAFGAADEVSSPTYVLQNIYDLGSKRTPFSSIAHWDLYRVHGGDVPEEDLRECIFDPNTLTLIEWPERCSWLDPLLGLDLGFEFHSSNAEERTVSVGGANAAVVDSVIKGAHLKR